jgi:hypothetical protein
MNARLLDIVKQSGLLKILEQHAGEFGTGTFIDTPYPEVEKFAELIISEFFIAEALSQSKPIPMENIGQYTVPCEVRNEGEDK